MNKHTAIVFIFPFLTSCSKAPVPLSNNSNQGEVHFTQTNSSSNAFQREEYRNINNTCEIILISQHELEFRLESENYVCKYTKESGAIRAIIQIAGTLKALYFQTTDEGLQLSDGTICYDTPHYRTVVEALKRQEETAAREKLENLTNAATLIIGSWINSHDQPIATFYLDGKIKETVGFGTILQGEWSVVNNTLTKRFNVRDEKILKSEIIYTYSILDISKTNVLLRMETPDAIWFGKEELFRRAP